MALQNELAPGNPPDKELTMEDFRKIPTVQEIISIKKAETAKWLALMIVGLFVAAVLLSLLYAFITLTKGDATSENLMPALELLKAISAVLSGPLGFVPGYYFAAKQGERE